MVIKFSHGKIFLLRLRNFSVSLRLDRYGLLPARIVDLVGDYAGKELFLVEGDSLLLRCFSDPKIDFDGWYSCFLHFDEFLYYGVIA